MKRLFYCCQLAVLCMGMAVWGTNASAQTTTIVDSTGKTHVIVIPGAQYERGGLHKMLWGKYYRDEWATPVTVPRLRLDTMFGGLKVTEKGGGKQTRHLRFVDSAGREYSIRSVDKRYGKSLPELWLNTFIEDVVDDQMSSAHPYGGVIAKGLAEAAGIYSTRPVLYFVGDDSRLDTFRNEFANQLYTLEDRPGDDNAKYYGASDVIETNDLLEKMAEDPAIRVDQRAYAKARLFDILIGDWDRHQDQWEWAEYKENGNTVFRAMPKDRDQAFSSYDGLIVGIATKAAKAGMMQPYKENIRDIEEYTWLYREVDMPMTNRLDLATWQDVAKELQQQVTDSVIARALRAMPPEVYAISADVLSRVLKARRDQLPDFATRFYKSLTKEVDILAGKSSELIQVTNSGDDLRLDIFTTNENGTPATTPHYSRLFRHDETDEIRVYGQGGNDRFIAVGDERSDIRVRFIGGKDKDHYEVPAAFGRRVSIYDNKEENTVNAPTAKVRFSSDSTLHGFNARAMHRDDAGFGPRVGYTNEDRLFVGAGYAIIDHAFRRKPFASKHEVAVRYSITQQAFNYTYNSLFTEAIGKWHLALAAEYDEVRDQDFAGVGNRSVKTSDLRRFYRYRTREVNTGLSLIRNIDSIHVFAITGFYQMVRLLNDADRYISVVHIPSVPNSLDPQHFAGARFTYDYIRVNDELLPNRGWRFNTTAEYIANVKNDRSIKRVAGMFGFFTPLGPLTLGVKAGAATLWGEPEFYQLNKIGGVNTLRGFLRWRFHGNTIFFNQNELQWNFNVRSYLFNGKMGVLALFDNGRVWLPGETSNNWHTAVGGGIMIAPFNRVSLTATYAVSAEDKRFSVRLGHLLNNKSVLSRFTELP